MVADRLTAFVICMSLMSASATKADQADANALPKLSQTQVVSSIDSQLQPIRYWVPKRTGRPLPMLVFLHSWSSDYTQDNSKWQREAVRRGWIYLHPNFRGVNRTPAACGSKLARQDVLDAIDFASEEFAVDTSRIYLAGTSGGGHMAMLMAGHHPKRFSAVSAWVGISDLEDWYEFHVRDGVPQKYAAMIAQSLQGRPGDSAEIDADYVDRSPIHHLHHADRLPVDISAGVRDGKAGSVPIRHSLNAFNVIAKTHGSTAIAEDEIETLWQTGRLQNPTAEDLAGDSTYTREVLLRRTTRDSRVTIFDGGHESFPFPACEWLSRHSRETSTAR